MKKFSKTLALMLVFLTAISALSISGYAVATPLEAGDSMENAANIPEFDVEYVSTLSEAGEVDWFKFTTDNEDAYYELSFVNYSIDVSYGSDSYLPNINLCDVNNQVLSNFLNDGEVSVKLENNTTYFVKIYMNYRGYNSTGNYQISVAKTYDVIPNEKINAKEIEINKAIVSSFDGTGDNDWFCFNAPVEGEYELRLKCYSLPTGYNENWSPNIVLYDKFDQKLGSASNYDSEDAIINATLEKGETYYLDLFMGNGYSSVTGNYEVCVSCDSVTVDPDTPDTPDIPDTPEETVTLSKISVASMPEKTVYAVGEDFDATGLVIKAYYSDGTSATVTNYVLGLFDSSSEGTKTIVVGYSENGVAANCEFTVTVEAEKEEDDGSLFSDIIMIILGFFTVIVDVIASIFSML